MITFNEVLPKIHTLLRTEPIVSISSAFQELTIIRDVYGKVHFYVELRANISFTDENRSTFHTTFERALGDYYSNDLWESHKKKVQDAGLIEVIKNNRVEEPVEDLTCTLYILERHQAKHIWTLQNTATPPWQKHLVMAGHKPAIVSFFSFKGGAGRTTSLIGTAFSLAKAGKKVVIVDLDLEAPGLSSIFFKGDEIYTGVVDYLIEKQIHKDQWSVHQHVLPINHALLDEFSHNLKIVPAGIVDSDFIQKLARLDFQHLTTNQVGARLRSLLDEIMRTERGLDFILLDARAGFHDIGGFALSDLSHSAVIVGQHTKQTWAGLSYVIERLAKPYNHIEDRLPVALVHSMAPSDSEADYIVRRQFREKAYDVFAEKYYSQEEVTPNSENSAEPFYPLVIPWEQSLRGDISFTFNGDEPSDFEKDRNRNLTSILTNNNYHQLAEKLCNFFDKTLESE